MKIVASLTPRAASDEVLPAATSRQSRPSTGVDEVPRARPEASHRHGPRRIVPRGAARYLGRIRNAPAALWRTGRNQATDPNDGTALCYTFENYNSPSETLTDDV